MKRPSRLYILRRPKLRQSWNKYNLYNIAQLASPFGRERQRTFFQQKWTAKAMTRAYHGEHVGEKKWRRLFSRRLFTSVEMPPQYLARHDGAEQGEGRGSGKAVAPGVRAPSALAFSHFDAQLQEQIKEDLDLSANANLPRLGLGDARDAIGRTLAAPVRRMTPYMQMTFWPLERRLDTAIFRALFASSVRQARQFVVHGAVTVNGIKTRHPQYLLNPGDMFQVDVEKVMYATGKARTAEFNKEQEEAAEALKRSLAKIEAGIAGRREGGDGKDVRGEEGEEGEGGGVGGEEGKGGEVPAAAAGEPPSKPRDRSTVAPDETPMAESSSEDEALKKRQRKQLGKLVKSAREILANATAVELSAKEKQELRQFRAEAQRAMSLIGQAEYEGDLVDGLESMLRRFTVKDEEIRKTDEVEQEAAVAEAETKVVIAEVKKLPEEARQKVEDLVGEEGGLTREEQRRLASLLRDEAENPVDPTKPYMTPWSPRPYMSPFAFIPRYLEVNQNICAAVYLRHPVARRGLGEVPTPFPYEINQLAYVWYLRRR